VSTVRSKNYHTHHRLVSNSIASSSLLTKIEKWRKNTSEYSRMVPVDSSSKIDEDNGRNPIICEVC